jgi:hypothetical protein
VQDSHVARPPRAGRAIKSPHRNQLAKCTCSNRPHRQNSCVSLSLFQCLTQYSIIFPRVFRLDRSPQEFFGSVRRVVLLHVTLLRIMCDQNGRAEHRERRKGRYAHQPLARPFGSRRRFPFRVTAPRHNAAPPVAGRGVRAYVRPRRPCTTPWRLFEIFESCLKVLVHGVVRKFFMPPTATVVRQSRDRKGCFSASG